LRVERFIGEGARIAALDRDEAALAGFGGRFDRDRSMPWWPMLPIRLP
jgi:hypothetical protein